MTRPLIIIAGADQDTLSLLARTVRDAFERELPEHIDPRITSTTGDADKIVLPAGWHTTHS